MATRRERVVLELEDQFTSGMARAAASAALLNKELDSLSRDSVRTRRSLSDIDRPAQNLGRSAGSTSREVDKLSGRMRIFADVAAVLGPSLIPIGAVGVPAVAGLAAQLGFAATGAATAILAFQGIGDTLKALNAAALDPTTANLEKAQVALEGLSPQAQAFVAQVGHMIPELQKLRDVAAAGLFPGLTEGLTELESGLPKVSNVISAVSTELGSIAADAGASLASEKWTSFLDFVAAEAPSALGDMAKAAGNTAHAVAALWMATDPLNDDFSTWLVNATADIDRWATSLGKTQGFADFVAYVESTGPKVAAALGAIANAAIQIVQAAAPLGGPVLEGIKALADVVAAIADSDIGTPLFTAAAALALFNRTLAVTASLQKATFSSAALTQVKGYGTRIRGLSADLTAYNSIQNTAAGRARATAAQLDAQRAAGTRLSATLRNVGKGGALLAGVGIAASGAADKIGLTNTASLALMGTLAGPLGAAAGAAVGATIDLAHANDGLEDAIKRVNEAARSGDFSTMRAGIKDLHKEIDDLEHTTSISDFFGDLQKKAGSALNEGGVGGFLKLQTGLFAFGKTTAQAKAENSIRDAEAESAARAAAAAQRILADGFIATADGADTASQSTQEFQRSLEKLNTALTGRASLRDYEQALDDFTKRQADRAKVLDQIRTENTNFAASVANSDRDLAAARKSGNKGQVADIQARRAEEARAHEARIRDLKAEAETLKNSSDIGTQAGRDTQALLDNIAATGIKVAQGLTGPKRVEFLAGVRTDFIKAATEAGVKDVQNLADHVLGLSAIKGKPKIVIDANGAWHVIDLTAQRLERLTRKTYKLNITAQGIKNRDIIGDIRAQASGGTVDGPRAPYGDKVLTMLAPGEEVVSNRFGQADRHRDLLKAINANRYADGGTIMPIRSGRGGYAPTPVSSSGLSSEDVDRIAGALLSARSIYGDVHLSGDGSFERHQRERLASLDGVRR